MFSVLLKRICDHYCGQHFLLHATLGQNLWLLELCLETKIISLRKHSFSEKQEHMCPTPGSVNVYQKELIV